MPIDYMYSDSTTLDGWMWRKAYQNTEENDFRGNKNMNKMILGEKKNKKKKNRSVIPKEKW